MPQKKHGSPGGRPIPLTDELVSTFAAGRGSLESLGIREPARPRQLSQEDVEAFARGQGVDLEALPPVEEQAGPEVHARPRRPRQLSQEDVEAFARGQGVDLEARNPIGDQILGS
jgi:hypothetical protein